MDKVITIGLPIFDGGPQLQALYVQVDKPAKFHPVF